MEKQSELFTTSSAARMLEASAGSVRLWADAGLLPVVRTTDGVRLFKREDLEAFKRARKKRRR